MSKIISGSNSKAWMRPETNFGEGFSTTTGQVLLNMTSESLSATYNKIEEDTLLASKTQRAQDLGSVTTSGSISTILKPAFADLTFLQTLGKRFDYSTTPGTSDPVYSTTVEDHGANFTESTYLLADPADDIPSSAIRLTRGTWAYEYTGLSISSLTLNCAAQDFVKADYDFMGVKEITYNDSTTPTATQVIATAPALVEEGSYKCTKAKLWKATAGMDDIDEFDGFNWDTCQTDALDVENTTVTFNNGLEETPATYCSGIYASRPVHGQRAVTIQCNIPYSEKLQQFREDYYASEEPDNLALMLAFCSKETYEYLGSKYPKEQVFIIIPNFCVTETSANISGQGLVDGSFSGTALSVGSTEPVKVIVRHYDSMID